MNKIVEWDERIIVKYNGFGGKNFTIFLKCVSFFGRETIWLTLIAFYLFIWYDPLSLSYIGTTFLFGVLFVLFIKNTVKRKRPFETIETLNILERNPTSRSFPSWHAYNVASQGIIIGILVGSFFIMIILLIFAALVAFSRIQLGVHYPSDVVMGYFLGIFGGILTVFLIGPFMHLIITYLEQFAIHEIEYKRLNSMLSEGWFILICIAVFGIIFLSAFRKILMAQYKKMRN